MVRENDWKRLRRYVESVRKSRRDFAAVAWAAVGIAAGALLALVPWLPAYSSLPAQGRLDFAWVTPVMAVVGIATAALAALAFVGAHILAKRERGAADELATEMDEIFAGAAGKA